MAKTADPRTLFRHELRRDGKVIAVLRGITSENGGVTVETEVHPVSFNGREPELLRFPFASQEQGSRFVEAALDALQYLGCTPVD